MQVVDAHSLPAALQRGAVVRAAAFSSRCRAGQGDSHSGKDRSSRNHESPPRNAAHPAYFAL